MTATGWFGVMSCGGRTGAFSSDFTDAAGNPLGDPYGSLAFMSLVVPNRVNDGKALPRVRVLLEGLKVARYDLDGAYLGEAFDNNPVWVTLDILRRSGWAEDELDLVSFAQAATYCSAPIDTLDLYGNPTQIPGRVMDVVLYGPSHPLGPWRKFFNRDQDCNHGHNSQIGHAGRQQDNHQSRTAQAAA